MMTRLLARAPLAVLSVWFSSATVSAQAPLDHRTTVAVGAGIANPLHADLPFAAVSWEAGVRRLSGFVSVEGVYSEWRHTDEEVRQSIPVQTLAGVIGHIGRLTQETRYVTRTVGVNVLLRHSFGRVAVWGGGGPAYMILSRRSEQTQSGCEGPVSCGSFSNGHTATSLAAQGTLGLDLPLGGRLSAFGHFGFALPVEDVGSGHTVATAGIRVGL